MDQHEYEQYQPISAWGYLGYELLFAIPILGTVICIFKAIGAKNRNVRNFARAQLLMAFIALVLGLIAHVMGISPTG